MEFTYYQLRAYLLKREVNRQATFKLAELEKLWHCSIKQCKRRLKQYQELGHLTYKPGKGRGNYSQLIFCCEFQQEIQLIVEKALQEDALPAIIDLLQLDIPKEWFEVVFKEIQGMFGVQQNQENQDMLRYILRRPITSLNPLKTAVSREAFLIRQLGDSLLTYDEETHQLQAGLAHHWRVSEDYRSWTFYLRKGVRFHHGRILTSEDVRHTLLQAKAAESVVSWQLQHICEIRCIDTYTVTVELRKGEPFFGYYVSTGNLAILPYDIAFEEQRWVSTGPFKMMEFSNQKIVLEVFEEYYGQRPLMDRIEFWVIESQELPVTVSAQKEFSEEDSYVEKQKKNVGVEFLIFNFQRQTVIQQPAFREAMYHLLDFLQMTEELDIGAAASRFYPERSELKKRLPEKIDSLLAQSGYQGETLVLGTFNYLEARKKANWLKKRAELYGIQLEIVELPIEESFYTKDFEKQTDMMMMGDIPATYKELAFLDFCCNPNLLCQRFFSEEILAELSRKVERMKFHPDYEQRQIEYEQIDHWLTDNYYLVYISHPVKKELVHSTIEQQNNTFSSYLDLRTAWAEKEQPK